MEYRDKKTLAIMSGLNNHQNNDDYYSRRNQRERERYQKKLITNFYVRNISFIDRIWWSLLSENERRHVYQSWVDYASKNTERDKIVFFIHMKNVFNKTQEIRDKKIQSLL